MEKLGSLHISVVKMSFAMFSSYFYAGILHEKLWMETKIENGNVNWGGFFFIC